MTFEDVALDEKPADLSSFRIPDRLLKKIGELAREGFDNHHKDPNFVEDLSSDDWTFIEEVITGFENR